MIKKDLYITQNGELLKKGNTIWFQNSIRQKPLPVAQTNAVYCFAEITINSKLLDFFTKHQIPIYFYNYYGFYSGVYAPKQETISGLLLVKQTESYQDKEKRLVIAKEFLNSALLNMCSNLENYKLTEEKNELRAYLEKLSKCNEIQELMLTEAKMRQFYYSCFNKIIKNPDFEFVTRVKQPPDNYINCLISFGNSCYYTTVLSEIFKTQLNPTVSYLHEPFERRYSLNLDISEIFKPIIVDRIIFTLINKNLIKPEHFDKELNFCYLNSEGRKIFLKAYDEKLSETFKHRKIGRKISYRYLPRLECYKLIKYLMESEDYVGFKMEEYK